jgi:hypothetical protein
MGGILIYRWREKHVACNRDVASILCHMQPFNIGGIFGKVLTRDGKTGLPCLIGRPMLDSWGAHGVRRHMIEGDTILSAKDEGM